MAWWHQYEKSAAKEKAAKTKWIDGAPSLGKAQRVVEWMLWKIGGPKSTWKLEATKTTNESLLFIRELKGQSLSPLVSNQDKR